jgi:hypothetical protein
MPLRQAEQALHDAHPFDAANLDHRFGPVSDHLKAAT